MSRNMSRVTCHVSRADLCLSPVCNEAPVTQPEASKASVLDMIEAAYPNPVSLEAMCR